MDVDLIMAVDVLAVTSFEPSISDLHRQRVRASRWQQPDTKTVVIKAAKPGTDLLWDSFYLFHGKLRSPVSKYTVDQIRANPPQPPLTGVCVARDLPFIQQLYPTLQVHLVRSHFTYCQVATS